MSQHKIDNQIKSKLNTREIQPSAQAWDRLDALLTVSEEKKSKKGYGWFFVVASVVFFFGFGFLFFYENETPKTNLSTPVVTTSKEEIDSIKTNKTAIISTENTKSILVQNEASFSKNEEKNLKSVEKKELVKGENVTDEKNTSNSQPPSSEKLLVEVQINQKEIPLDRKNIVKSKIKIDAASLLSTVEKELDQNFKETTLDKLSRKFQDVKSVIANRNYE